MGAALGAPLAPKVVVLSSDTTTPSSCMVLYLHLLAFVGEDGAAEVLQSTAILVCGGGRASTDVVIAGLAVLG